MLNNVDNNTDLSRLRFKAKFNFNLHFNIIKLVCKTIIPRAHTVSYL